MRVTTNCSNAGRNARLASVSCVALITTSFVERPQWPCQTDGEPRSEERLVPVRVSHTERVQPFRALNLNTCSLMEANVQRKFDAQSWDYMKLIVMYFRAFLREQGNGYMIRSTPTRKKWFT